jgi:hypothetical protein
MNHGFRPLFLVATLCAALIAGCGGGSGTTTTSSTTTAAKTSKASASSTTSHSTTASVTSASTTAAKTTPSVPANLGALNTGAISAYCKTALSAATGLSATEKTQFNSYCAALSHDNPTQLRTAEKTLCEDILSSVPAAYRSIAKAECTKL